MRDLLALRAAIVVGLVLGSSVAWGQPAPAPSTGSAAGSGSDSGSAAGSGSATDTGSGSGSDASTGSGSATAPTTAPLPEQRVEGVKIPIHGRVINALGKAVRGATITVEGTDVTTTSDKQGFYSLTAVAVGANLIVDADTYQTSLGIVTGGDVDDIVMVGLDTANETIQVKAKEPPATLGAAELDRSDVERVPGTGNDLMRTLSAMPGIVNSQLPLGYAGVVIRGAAPQDSQILVDDFEVPTLYHDIGFRSIIPTEAIDKLDYLPGGFDVGYGRAASGVVALTTRAGSETRSDQAEVSVIDGGVIAQGSIDKDTTYMIGFRRSLIDLLLPEIIPSSVDLSLTTVPRYYDEQFRIDHHLNSHWNLRLSSVGSDDALEIFGDKAENPDKRFYNRTRFARVTATAGYHNGDWTGTFALSTMPEEFIFELGIYQFLDIRSYQVAPRGELAHHSDQLGGLTNVVTRFGAEAPVTYYSINLALPQEVREGGEMGHDNPMDTSEKFNGSVTTPDVAQWAVIEANLSPSIRTKTGLRIDEFARIKDFSIQPRSELSVKLDPTLTLKLSGGAYVRPPEYQSELLASNVHPERATQAITGLQWQPSDDLRVQTSLYYTDRNDLIVYGSNGTSLVNTGRGTTYGAELFATYKTGPWFAFLTYSYSHSTRVDAPGDPEHLFDYDQPHNLNAALSWHGKKWQFGGRFELYSGLPLTPVIGSFYNSDTNLYTPIYGAVNSDRAPMHNQLDIRIDRYWKWGPVNMSWFLDVQNVYLNQSVVSYIYSYDYTQRAAFTSIPIIPSVGFRGQF